jgi:hypothetical protein
VTVCENTAARSHAFPENAMPVRDRWMTLSIGCHEPAEYTSSLKGIGSAKDRRGAAIREFRLCENHTRLFEQIDAELVQEAWAVAHTTKPVRVA